MFLSKCVLQLLVPCVVCPPQLRRTELRTPRTFWCGTVLPSPIGVPASRVPVLAVRTRAGSESTEFCQSSGGAVPCVLVEPGRLTDSGCSEYTEHYTTLHYRPHSDSSTLHTTHTHHTPSVAVSNCIGLSQVHCFNNLNN